MSKSKNLFNSALNLFPGGVNSPVRAFKPYPFYVDHAKEARLVDIDGNSYLDYCLGYGPLILGHAHPQVISAVNEQLEKGVLYGTPIPQEIALAQLIKKYYPAIEMLRFVNTGTEATLNAIRVARAYTGKSKIIKFEGAFHGAQDYCLVKAGSGATTYGVPTSQGILPEVSKETLVIPFNDLASLESVVTKNEQIAALIAEPIIGNAGCILPHKNFWSEVRRITEEYGILLIFDEIITGFRISLGGAQQYYKIKPDITTLGKILGGGFPIGCFGGRREIMEMITPSGKVYNAGTFNANPISITAGLTTLKILESEKILPQINEHCHNLSKGIQEILNDLDFSGQINSIASMWQLYFSETPISNYLDACQSDRVMFQQYHRLLLKRGIFCPPSQFECNFISSQHTLADIEFTLETIFHTLKEIQEIS
ncbi:MAG: glutamate-1-semialdehyde 2,1-aminomutase [Candidatus Helarchaeota archaeon]